MPYKDSLFVTARSLFHYIDNINCFSISIKYWILGCPTADLQYRQVWFYPGIHSKWWELQAPAQPSSRTRHLSATPSHPHQEGKYGDEMFLVVLSSHQVFLKRKNLLSLRYLLANSTVQEMQFDGQLEFELLSSSSHEICKMKTGLTRAWSALDIYF